MKPAITLYSVALTVGCYALSRWVHGKRPSPLTTPVLLCTALIIAALELSGLGFADYQPAKNVLTWLLGPASVALAVPVYRNRQTLIQYRIPALAGLVAGSASTLAVAVLLAKLMHLSPGMVAAISVKSTTTPVAVEIARLLGADPSLAAVFVCATGIAGAVVGPLLLNAAGVRDPLSRGLSLGTISHVFGTSQAAAEGELPGAIAAIAIVVAAVFTALAAPLVIHWLR